MYKVRLKVGLAALAFSATMSSAPSFAQDATGKPAVASPVEGAKSKAKARRQAAAERRKARREQRQRRGSAAEVTRVAAARSKDPGDDTGGDIMVTGTRIASNYGKTGSPVQTVDRAELRRRGLAHLEEALNSIPAIQPNLGNQTRNSNNDPASFGRSPVNLRNLGAGRTLVLVNGQRARNDTNNIPAAMIERIEILTGGASAIYGSDAVGGVINYILKRNYTGFTIDGEGSFFQHTNDNDPLRKLISDQRLTLPPRNFIGGPQGYINASGGLTFAGGRGNVTANVGYRVTGNLPANKYDNTACRLDVGPGSDAAPGGFNDRSERFCVTPGFFNPYSVFAIQGIPADQPGGPTNFGYFSNAYDGAKRFRQATDRDRVLVQNQDFIYRNDSRLDWGLNARFQIEEASQTEINMGYSRARYETQSETMFPEIFAGPIKINCDNPYLSPQQVATICGSQNVSAESFGNLDFAIYNSPDARANFEYRLNETRITAQAKGKVSNDIRYDVNIVSVDARNTSEFNSFPSGRRLINGLRARRVNGSIVCLPPQDSAESNDVGQKQRNFADDAGCQPIDIFSTAGPSAAARDYLIQNPGAFYGRNRDLVINGTISGTLGSYGIRSPFAKDALGFSLNIESRRQRFDQVSTGSVYNLPVSTDFREIDLSGELAVPLIQDKPFIKFLQVSGAYRHMDFQGATGSNWRLGADYQITDEVSLRGSYSTSYRVDPYNTFYPSTLDTFTEPRLLDLCSPPGGQKPSAKRLSAAQCQTLGVTAQQYAALTNRTDCNEAGFCPGFILNGGNKDLKPEQGRSITAGLTLKPSAIPRFSLSVDYYRIRISDFISYVDPYISFIQCQAGTAFYCPRYVRDPQTGTINVPGAYADARPANFGSQVNAGVDIVANYQVDLMEALKTNLGAVDLNFTGNLRTKNEQQKIPGQNVFDCTGYYGYGGKENCGSAPSPSWRHTVRVVWALPWRGVALNVLWRFIAPVKYAGLQSNPILSTPPTATDRIIADRDAYLPASSFFDLGASIQVSKAASVRFNISNVFDKNPYTIVNNNGGWYNTQPLMYDVFGRRVTIGFSGSF